MDESFDTQPEPTGPTGLGRRQFMARAVVVGGVAFAIPTIVTMSPAGAAALTSPPPEVEVLPGTLLNPGAGPAVEVAAAADPAVKPDVEVRGALAVTGAPIDVLLGAGAAAVAGGGALHTWSARAARRTPGVAETTPETTPVIDVPES